MQYTLRSEKLWLLLILAMPGVAAGQEPGASLDARLLRSIYAWDAPAVTAPLRFVNATAYPAFALAPLGAYATEGDYAPALRMATAEGGAALLAFGLKRLVRRARPYAREPGITLRTDAVDAAVLAHDDFSMPSGHATLAFAVAASWSMERPQWYVIVPAYGWATLVGVSRVWHGAHYPSDVLAGAALGTGAALLVQVLWPSDGQQDPMEGPMPVSLTLWF